MKQISAAEFKKWVEENKFFILVDVRERWENAAYNIGGIHIPLGEIIARKDEIQKGVPVILYCEKGIRSAIAIQRLEALGFDDLYNFEGGMTAWKRQTN